MNKIDYLGRGIHNEDFLTFLKEGNLSEMLRYINCHNSLEENIQKEKYLDVQIRSNYLNIYYNGGRIAKINSERSIEFDEKYFRSKTDNPSATETQLKEQKKSLIKKFKGCNYNDYFTEAMIIMDKWFSENPNPERNDQHLIAIKNRCGTDYTVIDIEYQVSINSDFACKHTPSNKKNSTKPKFDIIAVNKLGRLCVIELKKGTGALEGNSGLKDHWECYKSSIKRNYKPFLNEMRKVLEQKQYFNLINKATEIKEMEPEFIFAYAYNDKKTIDEQDRLFNFHYNKIGESIKVIKLSKDSYILADK